MAQTERRTAAGPGRLSWEQSSDLIVVGGVILVIVMMVLPMPPLLLDLLFVLNIALGLLVLMLTMNVRHALEPAVFPSLLLVLTLLRLGLNVSSTRLILLHGYAGEVIRAFGHFVVGGNYVVGFVVFLILVVIQFIVITRGAERVAEVAARFTLDAMPGKQMSIDADLNAGLITEREARQRRADIEREADFYGAMDGASKFVRGDAIASIVITLINIVGGFAVGVGQRGLAFDEAVRVYTLLTVGDGLVTQIPALLISTATGILITRAASESNLGRDMTRQMFANPQVLMIASGALVLFGLMPGLPTLPFLVLAGVAAASAMAAQRMATAPKGEREEEADRQAAGAGAPAEGPESVLPLLQTDIIELEIGYQLIPLVDAQQGGDLLHRITLIRRQLALELGLVVPSIRIRDNMQLAPSEYLVKVKGIEAGRAELMLDHYLAMDSTGQGRSLGGIPTREPAFGLPAQWIPAERREQAEAEGFTVVDPPSVLATHLTEILRRFAPELIGRQEVKLLLDRIREDFPAVVDELVPDLLTLGEIQKVLQGLLAEGVPIRDMVTILEALADAARVQRDPEFLLAHVRQALSRHISHLYAQDGVLSAVTLSSSLEAELQEALEAAGNGLDVAWPAARIQAFYRALASQVERAAAQGRQAVLLTSPALRRPLRRLTERVLAQVPVVSFNEISGDVTVQAVGTVELDHAG